MSASIPLTPVQAAQAHHAQREAPYRWFIAASLTLALGGGFALAIAVALAGAYEWDWGRYPLSLAQAHGQLQLIGFGGLFTSGMALRLMPRFSGRPLAFAATTPWLIVLIGGSLLLRAFAQPAQAGGARDITLIASAAAMLAGALLFATIVWRTLFHPESKAASTGWFFTFGALGFIAAATLNAELTWEMLRDDLAAAPAAKQGVLALIEQYGFLLLFLGGVGTRAVPTFTGHARPDRAGRAAAFVLATGVAAFAVPALWLMDGHRSETAARIANCGLLACAGAFIAIAVMTGVFWPKGDRVAAASRAPFWFVRSALGWLAFAGVLLAWYGANGLADGALPQSFALDSVRHVLAIGVLTNMILGMGMLVVPEFAGRRLQHPNEDGIILAMVIAVNTAVALRVWPSVEGVGWLEATRYWPMLISGVLAAGVVAVFAGMFAQSRVEQRRSGWATPQSLAERRAGRP